MPACCVPCCKNRASGKSKFQQKLEKNGIITFHKFPNNAEKQKKWLVSLNIPVPKQKDARVCSIHFSDSSFEVKGKKRSLRPEATPSIWPVYEDEEVSNNPVLSVINRKRKYLDEEVTINGSELTPRKILRLLDPNIGHSSGSNQYIQHPKLIVSSDDKKKEDFVCEGENTQSMILDEITGEFIYKQTSIESDEDTSRVSNSSPNNCIFLEPEQPYQDSRTESNELQEPLVGQTSISSMSSRTSVSPIRKCSRATSVSPQHKMNDPEVKRLNTRIECLMIQQKMKISNLQRQNGRLKKKLADVLNNLKRQRLTNHENLEILRALGSSNVDMFW